jgi:hypothetical protein
MNADDARAYASRYEKELGIPVVLPLEDGLDRLIPVFETLINKKK